VATGRCTSITARRRTRARVRSFAITARLAGIVDTVAHRLGGSALVAAPATDLGEHVCDLRVHRARAMHEQQRMSNEAPPMSALDAIYQRRAIRAYTSQPVDRATIEKLLDAAIHAPTAIHLEPWAFVVIQNRPLLEHICERAKTLAQTTHGALHRMLADPKFHIFYDAGTLVVICAKPMGPFVTADCWLAAENLMLAATALGLATCPIGFALPALADPELKAELGIPPEVTAIAPIVVGYPASTPPATARRPPEILSWKE
jgi:nitroreductase